MKKIFTIALVILVVSTFAQLKRTLKQQAKSQEKPYYYFENPTVCAGCHWEKFERFQHSQHSKAFTGDFFQKQLNDLVIASESFAPELKDTKDDCIGCHSPSAFLAGDKLPPGTIEADNHWNTNSKAKTRADRGVFCDFCHTISGFNHESPFNHDYISDATEEVDTKYGDLEFPWSPHHETATSELFEAPEICATCHNEKNPYGVWVKHTYTEYMESEYPARGIVCQTCHMQPMGGKPAKMGLVRPHNTDHWFGGGFTKFVEGAALVEIKLGDSKLSPGRMVDFEVDVQAVATGHKFPTGSSEERDVWLRLSLVDEEGKEILHIPVKKNTSDPNDKYFITSNVKTGHPSHSELSEPFERDALPEGDRLYHSVFLDSKGEVTYAQWMTVEEIENRLDPLEIRTESYSFSMPKNINGTLYLQATLNYRRMPDSFADYLEIARRPVIEVARDVRKVQ